MGTESLSSTNAAPAWSSTRVGRICTRYALPLLLLAITCGFAMRYGWLTGNSGPANAGLTIDPAHLDFGSAWQGTRVTMKLPVTNPTAGPVEVKNVQLSCGCTLVKPHAFTIEPGETRQLDVEIDLDAWPQNERHLDKRRFQALIAPMISESRTSRQPGWIINGVVTKLVTVSGSTGSLPDNLVAGQAFSPITITATYAVPLDALIAECIPPIGKAVVEGGPEVFKVQIAPKADEPVGPVHFDVSLKPHRTGENLPAAKLPMHGVIHQVVEPLPARVMIGAFAVGETSKHTIALISRTNATFTVKSWKASTTDTSVEALGDAQTAGKTQTAFRITQRIAELGRQECKVTFVVRVDDSREMEVPCAISYHGLVPGAIKR